MGEQNNVVISFIVRCNTECVVVCRKESTKYMYIYVYEFS